MRIILDVVLMGIFATWFMDIFAKLFTKLKVIYPLVSPQIVGRWSLYMLKGKFVHKDINDTPVLNNEKLFALIAHFLIGIALAGIFVLMEFGFPTIKDNQWIVLLFGVVTVFLPWFWLYPAIGLGFLASKTERKGRYIFTSFVNHTDFGFGMLLWIVLLRPLLFQNL